MPLQRTLLSFTYRPLRMLRHARRLMQGGETAGRLRVILFHDIAIDEREAFKAQLEWLRKRWTFVSPAQFGEMVSGRTAVQGDSLLLTFDDGYKSNHDVAKTILNPMGISALFFVISGFAELDDRAEQRRFVVERLYPSSGNLRPPEERIGQLTNMDHRDLRYLLDTGHAIGGHTATHARLSELVNRRALVEEIVAGADRLGVQLGTVIEHFAFTFGNLASFSPDALHIARARFRYLYTGMRGDNASGVPAWALRRDALDPNDGLPLTGAFLEGVADWRYRRDLATYEGWASTASSTLPSRR